jgi:hypothetical protein
MRLSFDVEYSSSDVANINGRWWLLPLGFDISTCHILVTVTRNNFVRSPANLFPNVDGSWKAQVGYNNKCGKLKLFADPQVWQAIFFFGWFGPFTFSTSLPLCGGTTRD